MRQNTDTDTAQSIEQQIAALEAKRAELLASKAREEKAKIEAIAAQIDALPAVLGVDSLEAVSALIARRRKGTLGSLDVSIIKRARTVVSEEEKAKAIAAVRAGEQRSVVSERLGIHSQTLWLWLKEAGLTHSRTPSPDAQSTEPAKVETATVAVTGPVMAEVAA